MMSYDYIKAVNFSTLKYLATSPLLYRWMIDHPAARKPAYVIGGAIHCAVLEPGQFDSRYAVFDGTRRGKAWDEWQLENPGKESLKPNELASIQAAAKAVHGHRVAAGVLLGGRVEEPVTWIDSATGLACKGRIDYIRPDCVVDLKSARDVAPRRFARAAAEYLYHGQLAWYHDGAIAAGKVPANAQPPYCVAVQSDEPYDVAVYQINLIDLDVGRQLCRDLLRKLVECAAADYWPGVAPDLLALDLPAWAPGSEIETTNTEEAF